MQIDFIESKSIEPVQTFGQPMIISALNMRGVIHETYKAVVESSKPSKSILLSTRLVRASLAILGYSVFFFHYIVSVICFIICWIYI